MQTALGQQRIDFARCCCNGSCASSCSWSSGGCPWLGRVSLVQRIEARSVLEAMQARHWPSVVGRLITLVSLLGGRVAATFRSLGALHVVVMAAAVGCRVLGRLLGRLSGGAGTSQLATWQQSVAAGAMQVEARRAHGLARRRCCCRWCLALCICGLLSASSIGGGRFRCGGAAASAQIQAGTIAQCAAGRCAAGRGIRGAGIAASILSAGGLLGGGCAGSSQIEAVACCKMKARCESVLCWNHADCELN